MSSFYLEFYVNVLISFEGCVLQILKTAAKFVRVLKKLNTIFLIKKEKTDTVEHRVSNPRNTVNKCSS